MGTRNITAVQMGGEYKIAQYGQWDGYPEGQGKTILAFLAGEGNLDKLRAALGRVRFLDPKGQDKAFVEEYEQNAPEWSRDPDNRTPEQKRWFERYITRDLGGEILANVAMADEPEILLRNSISFAADSLFCEWGYVVDLDANTLEVFKGFNEEPLAEGERFRGAVAAEDANKEYTPIRLIAKYPLDALPTLEKLVEDCQKLEEAEEGA